MRRQFIAILASLLVWFVRPAGAAGAMQTAQYFAEVSTSALPTGQTAVLAVVTDIKPGLHAQSHMPLTEGLIPFNVAIDPNPSLEFLDPVYPKPETKNFPGLGNESVYTGRVIVYIPIRIKSGAAPSDLTLTGKLTWQACNDSACFAPQKDQPFSVQTKIVPASQAVTPTDPPVFAGFDASIFASGATASAGTVIDFFGHTFTLGSTSIGLAFAVALAVGLLFNLMPCVLPVVPLKAIGFFEVSKQNRAKCFFLGLVFSAGVVSCFIALGILILVAHAFAWGQQFSSGWFIWSITALLLVFGLGMFGLFDVILPDAVYNVTLTHDSIAGNYLFGIFTAILSTPCTAPMMGGLLTWALAQPASLGVGSVVMVGVGMALPYLLLSAFPNLVKWVPHTGPWSLVLKQMMGFLLIAAAVYFGGGRLVSGTKFIWGVFGVVAIAMVFLVIRTVQLTPRFRPVIGSLISAVVVIAIALDITLRLTGGLDWQPYSADAFAHARASGKPVLVEFTANWCGNCLALEASVFHDPKTAAAVKQHEVVLLRADMTDAPQSRWDVVNQLNPGGGIPLTAIYGPNQPEPTKLTSLYTTQNLLDALDRATLPQTN
jgi:thiol:disulfide interchange protein DsbD